MWPVRPGSGTYPGTYPSTGPGTYPSTGSHSCTCPDPDPYASAGSRRRRTDVGHLCHDQSLRSFKLRLPAGYTWLRAGIRYAALS